jgi:hypothetical protein
MRRDQTVKAHPGQDRGPGGMADDQFRLEIEFG